MFGALTIWLIIGFLVLVIGLMVRWTRGILDDNRQLRARADMKSDSDEAVYDDRSDLRQNLDMARVAMERMILSRSEDGIKSACNGAAEDIENLYLRSFGNVAQRREAIAAVVKSRIVDVIKGGNEII